MHTSKTAFIVLFCCSIFLIPGCDSIDVQQNAPPEAPSSQAPVTGSVDLMVTRGFTVDVNGETVVPEFADPATLLYYR